MIGRYTSTSVTTLFRKGAAALRAPRVLKQVAKRFAAVQRTLATAPPQPHPVLRGPRPTRSLPPPNFAHARSVRYGSPSFASAARPRGGVQNVGLGKARTFATAPPVGSVPGGAQNVPVILRAFAQLLDDDDLPKPTRYTPYVRRPTRRAGAQRTKSRMQRQRERRSCPSIISNSTEGKIRDLAAYFPLPFQRQEQDVPLPPVPEVLLTPGHVTTLSLALAPSLDALLDPTPRISYADAEVGVAILAGLTQGLMPLHEAYAAAGARVIPLLSKLDALGVLDPRGFPATTLEVSLDADGNPDILRVIFAERCADDVRELLGDLVEIGVLTERAVLSANEVDAMRASWGEQSQWADHSASQSKQLPAQSGQRPERPSMSQRRTLSYEPESVHELVMPAMDMSREFGDNQWLSELSESFPPSSGTQTPDTLDIESLASPSDSEWSSPPGSLIGSLASLEDQSLERSYAWSVYPSETDSVVESWREVQPTVIREQEVEVGWVEFGLMQAW